MPRPDALLFRQLFDPETSTYTYLLADEATGEGVIIDPVREQNERDLRLIQELGIRLLYTMETHVHADHVTGAERIRSETGAKAVVSRHAGVECADLLVGDGDEIVFGSHRLKVLSTPGHTNGCLSFFGDGRVYTGDALMIRACGRTDFQSGSAEKMYESVHGKLYTLPDDTLVYPGHDYKGMLVSTIGEEKKHNPRLKLGNSKERFAEIMANLKLAPPKKIKESVPANQKCGSVA